MSSPLQLRDSKIILPEASASAVPQRDIEDEMRHVGEMIEDFLEDLICAKPSQHRSIEQSLKLMRKSQLPSGLAVLPWKVHTRRYSCVCKLLLFGRGILQMYRSIFRIPGHAGIERGIWKSGKVLKV